MNRCDICNKGSLIGHNVSHSKRRTIKKQQPNLHKVTLAVAGKKLSQKLCSDCLRTIRRDIARQTDASQVQSAPITQAS